MNIAIMIYSKTGTTLKLATVIKEKLAQLKHDIQILDLKPKGEINPHDMSFELAELPDLSKYDVIIAGTPVWAFAPAPVILKAISLSTNLAGKIFIPFVTMSFPLPGMGGTRSLRIISEAAKKQGAKVKSGAIACRMLHNLDLQIEKAAQKVVNTLPA